VERRKKLRAVTFGSFEVYADKTPLVFRRTKTKELLAYMIDRRGAETSVNTLCAVLWPDETDDERKRDYLYHLFSDLKKTLKDAGFPDAVLSRGRGYAVDTQKIDCDYYHLLDGDARARRSFVGEYMDQYSWSEPTCAWLTERYVSRR
jgi:two-component SAPR family response regulator